MLPLHPSSASDDERDIKSPSRVVIDQQPDERGNLSVAATFVGGRMIALALNAN